MVGYMRRIPKVLLHTHLEGSLPLHSLKKLGKRNGVFIPGDFPAMVLREIASGKDWGAFRKYFSLVCSCFCTYLDFRDAVLDYSSSLQEQNVGYVEVHVSPWKHLSRGVSLDDISKGLELGIRQARKQSGVTVKIICDFVRNQGERVLDIYGWFSSLPRENFVAIGISGGTGGVPRRDYVQLCERAKEAGYYVTAHAGEFEGPESVEFVIDSCLVDRVAHGIRLIESPGLLNSEKVRQVHFDVCPSSTRVRKIGLPDYGSVRIMLEQGLRISVNTDDELFFSTDMTRELSLLEEARIISSEQVMALQRTALEGAFIHDGEERRQLEEWLSSADSARSG